MTDEPSAARTSDADRDRTIDVLRAAYAEGRLDHDEHEARVAKAMTATTYADLLGLVADLPTGPLPAPTPQAPPPTVQAPPRAPARRPAYEPTAFLALLAGLVTATLTVLDGLGATRHLPGTLAANAHQISATAAIAAIALGHLGVHRVRKAWLRGVTRRGDLYSVLGLAAGYVCFALGPFLIVLVLVLVVCVALVG